MKGSSCFLVGAGGKPGKNSCSKHDSASGQAGIAMSKRAEAKEQEVHPTCGCIGVSTWETVYQSKLKRAIKQPEEL